MISLTFVVFFSISETTTSDDTSEAPSTPPAETKKERKKDKCQQQQQQQIKQIKDKPETDKKCKQQQKQQEPPRKVNRTEWFESATVIGKPRDPLRVAEIGLASQVYSVKK